MRRAYLHGLSSTLGRHSNRRAKLAGGAPAGRLPARRNRIVRIGRLRLVSFGAGGQKQMFGYPARLLLTTIAWQRQLRTSESASEIRVSSKSGRQISDSEHTFLAGTWATFALTLSGRSNPPRKFMRRHFATGKGFTKNASKPHVLSALG